MTPDTHKKWWESRTLWVQIIAIVFAVLAAFDVVLPQEITQEGVLEIILMGVAIVTAILRLRTDEAIKPTNPVITVAQVGQSKKDVG